MTNTKLKIMPDDRLPLGKSNVYICSVCIEPVPSAKGGFFDVVQLELHLLYQSFNMTVKKIVNIPIFWSDEGTFVKMLRAFNIMKSIGEEIDIKVLTHKFAEIYVEENIKNGRTYRNVSEIVPLSGKPHPFLQKLYDASEEACRMSNNIFDDEGSGNIFLSDHQVRSEVSEENANAKLPPPSIAGIKRRRPSGLQNEPKASSLKRQLFDDGEDLGSF